MADKCATCGKSIALEPDANGGSRWYSGEGTDASTTCTDENGAKLRPVSNHTPAAKETAGTSKGGT